MPDPDTLKEAEESLKRIQGYDTSRFDNVDELGRALSLKSAIEPAEKLINLFQKIPVSTLSEFADRHLNSIKQSADQVYALFNQAEEFNTQVENPSAHREQIIQGIRNEYDPVFTVLFPLISFSAASATDFQRLEREGRAAVQSISDQTAELFQQLQTMQDEAETILADVRKTAAEQGVSQQAVYFKQEADDHAGQARHWRWHVYGWFGVLLIYCILAFFIHKVPILVPQNTYESIQIVASKVLIFAVLAYMLLLSARNFLSHKHNSVANKHRQNSLATFQALVDAGGTKEARDVVLRYAAASVFSPQETGYSATSNRGSSPSASTVVELGSQVADQ